MAISLPRLWLRLHPHWWGRWRYYPGRMLLRGEAGYEYGVELWMRERQCRICGRLRIEREQQRQPGRFYKSQPSWVHYAEQLPPGRNARQARQADS